MNRLSFFTAALLISVGCFLLACSKQSSSNSSQIGQMPISPSSSNTASQSSSPSISKDAQFSQALNDYNSKNYEKAATGFNEIVKADPQNASAYYYLGKSYKELKKDNEAIGALKEAVRIKPDHADANFALGNIYYGQKNYETSLPYFEQAAKTNFKSVEILIALAENQRVLKQFDKAIVQYGKVIGFEPNNANAYYGMGLTYLGLNNKIAARQQLQKLQPLDKDLAKKLADQIGS
jgi:tetratricopeptide (TPR) repeat protein